MQHIVHNTVINDPSHKVPIHNNYSARWAWQGQLRKQMNCIAMSDEVEQTKDENCLAMRPDPTA